MGHNIRHFEYDVSVDKSVIQKKLDNFVAAEDYGEGASGLPKSIRWQDNIILDSYEDAEKWIAEHDRGWYDQLAVKYRDVSSVKSKKITELEQRRSEVYKKLSEANNILYSKTVKSAYIGCKKCGSKLAAEYLRSNKCPLCSQDFRSTTTLNNLAAMKDRLAKIDESIREAKIYAGRETAKTKWLVKIEYHT